MEEKEYEKEKNEGERVGDGGEQVERVGDGGEQG